jgi:putative lipoprotein
MLEIRPRLAMWNITVALLALLLAACAPVNATQSLAGRSQYDGTLGGSVNIRTGAQLPAGARVVVNLVDLAAPDAPLAQQTLITQGGQPPYPYLLAYDAQGINSGQRYGVKATILAGDEVLYSMVQPAPVLTFGAPASGIDLTLQEGEVLLEPEVAGVLRGSIVYAGSETLPEGTEVVVELINQSSSPLEVVATQRVNAAGVPQPIPFRLEYDPAAINAANVYALAARATVNGLVRYLMVSPISVLTGGAPADNVELALRPANERTGEVAAEARGAIVSGVVDLGTVEPVTEGTVIEIEIVDTAQPDVIFARTTIDAGGLENPVPFTVPLVREVQEGAEYTIQARVLVNGALPYKQRPPQPVLVSGVVENSVYLDASKMPPPPLTGTITGTVTFSEEIALPIDAYGVIELYYEQDGLPVMTAQQLFFPEAGQPPFDVVLYYPVDVIDRSLPYTVTARILVEAMNWFTGDGVPVLYGEEPIMSDVKIELTATAELLQQLADEAAAATEIAATATAVAAPSEEPTVEATATDEPPAATAVPEVAEAETPAAEATPEPDGTALPVPPLPADAAVGMPATPLEEGEYLVVLGTLLLPAPQVMPAGAVAKVQVLDVSTSPFTLVAEQSVDAAAEFPPIPFDIAIPVDAATDLGAYALDARILVGDEVRWQSTGLMPLLGADGPRTELEMELEVAEEGMKAPTFATPGPRPTAAPTPVRTPTPAIVSTLAPLPSVTTVPGAQTPVVMPTVAAVPSEIPAGEVRAVVRAASAALLPAGATVTAQLRKGAGAAAQIVAEAEENVQTAGGPVAFALPYGAGVIEEDAAYSVAVRVTLNGELIWLTGRGFPVITNGAPSVIEVEIR